MEEDGTWATDAEILATACLLRTDIFVFTRSANGPWMWHLFKSTSLKKKGRPVKRNNKSLYFYHHNLNHYMVVHDVY
ncbi:OVARIAN TUMOR DOMAIN-containing deubiquitinating enzyme 7 [Frankliniella fusca]|nr:OVARIAN TUMOR DOMAIN-containing deubiquitinating enzyme 7 [Frankliniella fusca]